MYPTKVTGFDVDDFLVDLYFYFDKSTKRKAELVGKHRSCKHHVYHVVIFKS